MTKKLKNILLGAFSLAAMTTTCLSFAFSFDITADADETSVFEMVYGAGIRVSDPTGMRFKTKFSENYYEELTADNTDTQMFVSIFPYADYTKYDTSGKELAAWLDSYYGAGNYINIAMDPAKFYQTADDEFYYGNAVISNIYFNNYHREFVGVAYLRRGTAGNYTYEYTESITKEEFIVLVMKAMGAKDVPVLSKTRFADDKDISIEYKGYIESAFILGIIEGERKDEGIYINPKSTISTAEAAVMINKIIGATSETSLAVFKDYDDIPDWARSAIISLNELGIISKDDGKINPNAPLSRAQTARILMSLLEYRGKVGGK